MLSKAKRLEGYKLDGLDGELEEVKEFYFDDRHWTIRYLVANTGNWLTGRQVLISPYALVGAIKAKQHIAVDLTESQIENSPSLNSDEPASRQFEQAYSDHYGWPRYWNGPYMWGSGPNIARDRESWKTPTQGEKAWDAHLRSTDSVCGYEIQALDGDIDHVEDFIIDDEDVGDSVSGGREAELVAGEKGPGCPAMERARELERVESHGQSVPRHHRAITGIHRGDFAHPGL